MKQFNLLALILLWIMGVASCSTSVDKVLPRQGGKWESNQQRWQKFQNGIQVHDTVLPYYLFYEFRKDGSCFYSGAKIPNDSSSLTGTWTYDEDKNYLTVSCCGGTWLGGGEVTESSQGKQTWVREVNDANDKYINTTYLSRAK